ncbi:MAG: winged helix-turn-helix domain-containing protein [Lysobacterales bacterium]
MTHGCFQFGDYRLDIRRRELCRGAAPVELQLKVFDTLAWLIQHRDRAVGRDELIAAVWGKVDVSDNVLGQIIGRARQAVGDDGSRQHTIHTVPRFGYRWVAATTFVESPALDAGMATSGALPESARSVHGDRPQPDSPSQTATGRRPWRSTRRWLLLALIGSLLLLTLWWSLIGPRAPQPTQGLASDGRAGMVLPVITDPDPELAWMRLGVADFIAERLRRYGLAVMPTETMVALSHGWQAAQPSADELTELTRDGAVGPILRSRAVQDGGEWLIEIENIADASKPEKAQGRAADVLVAAGIAVDRLQHSLGFQPPAPAAAAQNLPLDQILQQVRAAILADDLAHARALLDAIEATLSKHPDVILERAQIDLASGQVERPLEVLTGLAADPDLRADPLRHARVLHALGHAHLLSFEFALARQDYSAGIALLTPPGNLQQNNLLGRLLLSRGRVALQQHEVAAAEVDHSNARLALESSGDQVGLARLNNNQAVLLLYEKNQPEAALPLMAKVADQARSFHDASGEARARINLMSIARLLLAADDAQRQSDRLQQLTQQIADPSLRQLAQLTLARRLTDRGQLSGARAILQANGLPVSESSDPALAQLALALRAQLEFSAGRFEQVQQAAVGALQAELADADSREYALTWLADIRARRALGRPDQASEQTLRMQAWANRSDDPIPHLYASLAVAENTARGDADDANDDGEHAWQQAHALAAELRIPFEQLQVARSHAQRLLDQGRTTLAVAVIDRVAAYGPTQFDAALLQLRLYHRLGQTRAWATALARAQELAGERVLPDALVIAPGAGRR